jgi:hypothetical protein
MLTAPEIKCPINLERRAIRHYLHMRFTLNRFIECLHDQPVIEKPGKRKENAGDQWAVSKG